MRCRARYIDTASVVNVLRLIKYVAKVLVGYIFGSNPKSLINHSIATDTQAVHGQNLWRGLYSIDK